MDKKRAYSSSLVVTNEVADVIGNAKMRRMVCENLLRELSIETLESLFFITEKPFLPQETEISNRNTEQTKFTARIIL